MTTNSRIHPVILCGGSGTRLWPVSRKARPKPFLPLLGEQTLFEQTVGRASDPAQFASPIVVAGNQHADLIDQQITAGSAYRLVIEPAARNTAPAIALAAALLEPDNIMLVCPSDHHISDEAAFRAAAIQAAELARDDWLVAFGIAPDRPETGYGYIKRGQGLAGGYRIDRFVEKPDLARAQEYLESGEYSWNGGIFVFRAGALLAELARHRPAMADAVGQSVEAGHSQGSHFLPAAEPFEMIEGESIDYAVMENAERAAVIPVDMGWSDIGNWAALHDAKLENGEGEGGGNAAAENCELVDCTNVLAVSDGPRISAIGLDNVCIVVDGDEVLVTTRDGAQKVGKLRGASQQ